MLKPIDVMSCMKPLSGIDKQTCVLHIPSGSLKAYQETPIWKDFINKVEEHNVGTAEIYGDRLRAYSHDGVWYLTGVGMNESLYYFSESGQLVYRQLVESATVVVPNLAKGVYLVKGKKSTLKLVL